MEATVSGMASIVTMVVIYILIKIMIVTIINDVVIIDIIKSSIKMTTTIIR